MVPNVAGTGPSFKGAALYYLHDKRQKGEEMRLTQDRVSWTQTRNLATADPELAWKIMAATALDQDRLKAEAGVKNTGRKSSNAVYAYSIAWHPDEVGRIGQAEMVRAAEESIQALGAGDRQILIVAHNDTDHPHVHVLINRVSPQDGRMLGTSNDYKKLDAWALAYRKARGEDLLYCPARAEKRDAMERRADGEDVPFVRGESPTPRSMMADLEAARLADAQALRRERDRQRVLNGELGAKTRAMHEDHRAGWAALSKAYAGRKAQIYETAQTAITRSRASITEQYRPSWRELLRRQWRQHRVFEENEKTVPGKIGNALRALANRSLVDPEGARGLLSSLLNFAVSKPARSEVHNKLHAREQAQLRAQERKALDQQIHKIKADRAALLARSRLTFAAEREALIAQQASDKQSMQQGWRTRKIEMAISFDTLARNAAAREAAARVRAAEPDHSSSPFQKDFNAAGKGPRNDRPHRTRRR